MSDCLLLLYKLACNLIIYIIHKFHNIILIIYNLNTIDSHFYILLTL